MVSFFRCLALAELEGRLNEEIFAVLRDQRNASFLFLKKLIALDITKKKCWRFVLIPLMPLFVISKKKFK